MKRRVLAWILCVVMMVMAIPMTAFAQTENGVAQVSSWEEFVAALEDESVGTISLATGITSPQGAGDDAVFLNRSLTILGNGNTMSLNAGGLILGGDVTLENIAISFNNVVRNAIIANGYTLTLSDVRNGSGVTSIHVFAGGISDYNGSNVAVLPETGEHGQVVVKGDCQLGNIYAGSLSDGATEAVAYANVFDGDVTITIDESAVDSTVGNIYACGARESRGETKPDLFYDNPNQYKVNGSASVELCSNNVASVDGETGGTTNAAVSFADAEDNMYSNVITFSNLSALSVEKGYLELSADSSLNANTAIAVSYGARLSLMQLGEAVSVGNFTGSNIVDSPGELELKVAQTLTINGAVSGETSVGVGGIAYPSLPEEGRTYISAPFAAGLTGDEFAFVDYGGMLEYTPVYVSGSNAWIAPGIDYTVVVSAISADSKTVVSAENVGVEIPISASYSQRPDEYSGVAYVPLVITVNEEEAVRDGSEEWGYTYEWGDLTIAAYMSYNDADELYEYLYIEGAAFTVPEGTYRFVIEVPAENMADGEAKILSFTLVVGEEEIVLQPIEIPVANTNLSYNGAEQIGVPESEGYTLTGHRETNAGSYTAVATLEEGYKWSDETTAPKSISWKIEQAPGEGSVSLKSWKEGEPAKTPNATSATNDGSVSFLYKLQGAEDGTYIDYAVPPAEAGKYTLKAIFESTQNYKEVVAYADFSVFHAMKHVEAEEATCEEAGNAEHWYCTVCEKYYSDADGAQETTAKAVEIPATDHDWDSWTEVDGENHKRVCKNDANHTETEPHTYTDGVCVCGRKEEIEVVLQPVDVPTAKTNLLYNGTEQMGVPEGEGYALTGHRETNAGSYTAVATLAEGYQWSDETTAPKNISWKIEKASGMGSVSLEGWTEGEEPKVPTAKSRTNDGDVTFAYKQRDADDDTYIDFTVPPTIAGEYTLMATFESTQNYTEASAYADFVIVHAMDHATAQEATCENAGNVEYWYCTVCDKYYLDADATQETTAKEVEIPATDHDWGPWTKVDDENHKRTCKNDGNHIETEAHSYEEGTCVCGHEEETVTGVEGFIIRLYQVCLEREPDEAGLEQWVEILTEGTQTGTQVAYGFVFSDEFKGKNYCNEHYVKQLYLAFMGRGYDDAGLESWLVQLKNGATREEVFNGFAQSNEFKDICVSYGIDVGQPIAIPAYGTVPKGPCSVDGKEDGVTEFVKRLYDICLGREADEGGLDVWREGLWNHTMSGVQVARGFIFSTEFVSRNYDNATYVEYLYPAFLGREADDAGKASWVILMTEQGWTREEVFWGFANSDEFTKICNSYGIVKN